MRFSIAFFVLCLAIDFAAYQTMVSAESVSRTESQNSFRFGQVVVQGSTVHREEIIQTLQKYSGKDLSSKKVQTEIQDAVNKLYIENGYLTSRVSKVDFKEGVLTIQIIEGGLRDIIIENERELSLRPSFIRDRVGLGGLAPLNINLLEGQLKLLDGDPLLENLEASLRPTGISGKTDLNVPSQRGSLVCLKIYH